MNRWLWGIFLAELTVHRSLLDMSVMERNMSALTHKYLPDCKDALLTILRSHGKATDGCTKRMTSSLLVHWFWEFWEDLI